MTYLVGGPKPVTIAEPEIDMSDIAAGTATVKTATAYRRTLGSSFDQFAGSFTYDSSGNLVGGTITGWKRVTGGAVEFTATGISLPVTAFLAFLSTDDTAGFLSAVFSGDDKMIGSATFDDFRGGSGNTPSPAPAVTTPFPGATATTASLAAAAAMCCSATAVTTPWRVVPGPTLTSSTTSAMPCWKPPDKESTSSSPRSTMR